MRGKNPPVQIEEWGVFRAPNLKEYLLAKELLLPLAKRQLTIVSFITLACFISLFLLSVAVVGTDANAIFQFKGSIFPWFASAWVYTGLLLLVCAWAFLLARVNKIKLGHIEVLPCRLRAVQSRRENGVAKYVLAIELPNGFLRKGLFYTCWDRMHDGEGNMSPAGIIVRCGQLYGYVGKD